MSCDKWAYDPKRCDDTMCCGDCDFCTLWQEDSEDEFPQSSHKVPMMAESFLKIYNMIGRALMFANDLQEKRAMNSERQWGE